MLETANLVGALTAHLIFLSSILTFSARLLGHPQAGKRFGYLLLASLVALNYKMRGN